MKRGMSVITLILILLLTLSFVSAGWFDWFTSTGNVVAEDNLLVKLDFDSESYNVKDFDGTNDYFDLGLDALPSGQGTLSTWVYVDEDEDYSGYIWITTNGQCATSYDYLVYKSDRLIGYYRDKNGNKETISSEGEIKKGEWNQVIYSWGKDGQKIYLNGALDANKPSHTGQGNLNLIKDNNLGGWGACANTLYSDEKYFLNGKLDDFRIYNTQLSDADAKILYQESLEAFNEKTPVAPSPNPPSQEVGDSEEGEENSSENKTTSSEENKSSNVCEAGENQVCKEDVLLYTNLSVEHNSNVKCMKWDINGDGMISNIDGNLIIRYLLGGKDNIYETASTYGMKLNSESSRFKNDEITEYIRSLEEDCLFDVDGDGIASPMSDGIMIARYLNATFTNDITINGDLVNKENATRQTEEEIREFLESCQDMCGEAGEEYYCNNLLEFLEKPSDLTINGNEFELMYNLTYESSYDSFKQYSSSWAFAENNQYSYYYFYTYEIESKKRIEERLEDALNYGLCEQDTIELNDGSEQVIYLCKDLWRLAYEDQEITDYADYENDVAVLWTNNNRFFNLEISKNNYYNCYSYEDCMEQEQYKDRRDQEDLINAIEKLIDNNDEYVGGFYLDYPERDFVKYFLNKCGSDIELSNNQFGSWRCKIEPVVCPPHGEQTEICTRYNYEKHEEDVREDTIQCSPGICSGCYIPRWFDYVSDNKCVPYGFRFEHQTGWDFKDIFVEEYNDEDFEVGWAQEEDEIDLEVYENETAFLSFRSEKTGEMVGFYVEEGKTYDLDELIGFKEDNFEYELYVENIYYDSEEYKESSIDVNIYVKGFYEGRTPETINAYCDLDGGINEQKVDASCQNNYECFSNLCSGGECVDIQGQLEETGFFQRFVVSLLCRIANPISEEERSVCINNFLTGEESSTSSSGSGGGSSGDSN